MKVYFVINEPSERTINHFVSSLGDALEQHGCEVVYGYERLWTDEVFDCDIVHFQWPEYIFSSQRQKLSEETVERLRCRLAQLKEKGIRIFVQVHNLKPHVKKDKNILCLYDLLYRQADVMVHMGTCSRNLLQAKYPEVQHVVIPHHIYDNVYRFAISREEARKTLHLPVDKKIVLSFGRFRTRQERDFVLDMRQSLGRSALFLMPGFYRETLHTWNPKKFLTRLYHTVLYKIKGIRFSNEVIPDSLMQCYFCAADAVLIQRLDILNSGNLPMAFAAGKVVVGPDVGNVGPILRETGNFVFDPRHPETAENALRIALEHTDKGNENKMYATMNWASDIIAKEYLNSYRQTQIRNESNC